MLSLCPPSDDYHILEGSISSYPYFPSLCVDERQTGRETRGHTYTQADTYADRQADTQTDIQTERRPNRQMGKQGDVFSSITSYKPVPLLF